MATVTIERALQIAAAHHQAGQLADAEKIYRQILAVHPQQADALHLLGLISAASGRHEEALGLISQAVALTPAEPTGHNDLGVTYQYLGRFEDALASYRRALELRPDFAEAHYNRGSTLSGMGRWDEAIASLQRALALAPDSTDTQLNFGNALFEMGRWDEAITCFQRVLALRPELPVVHGNLAMAWLGKGQTERALACHREFVNRSPNLPAAHWNLALALLLLGQYEEGWKEHEWRHPIFFPQRDFSTPRWDGTCAIGQTILIYTEQGYGDAIQFLRYVPLVKEHAGASRVILECQPRLARFLDQTGGWSAEIVARESAALPAFDQHAALLSLPLALGLFEPRHPALPAEPYLRADSELRAAWRKRLGARAGLRVGLAWMGNPEHVHHGRRSIETGKLLPLLRVPAVTFYNLQIEPDGDSSRPLVEAGLIDLTTHIADFADTAALMAELDLVISVDTATAHLAGALGRPVWTLLPFIPDWRWGLEREETPWYPTMRLFRQPTMGDWDSVVQRVAAELPAER